jgi:integrase
MPIPARDRAAIPHARYDFHALRHYAASAWIKQRVDLKRLTTWLGHSSVQMSLNVYGHLVKDDHADAAIVAATAAELLA